ncbi:unnamed protein product [Sphenostylis stenocarpa]|uniref:Peptidase A1 domain-containing protein n=1 Tax=Sphenostylis stenocarpa TaxID=92480 RepID=A0AA86VGM1_9FABA|nr:unnamed protein product [Sphenostylis stenocarpa]
MGCGCVSLAWVMLVVVVLGLASESCYGSGTFGFDIHHRFSDPVMGILGIAGDVPQKGSPQYYAAMAHRDRIFRGRRLTTDHHTPLTFAAGNDTYQIPAFGFLHFANVSVGTPPLWFLVALDTGSDLFWLPCNCTNCVPDLVTSRRKILKLNKYDLDKSSTSNTVSCTNSSFCKQRQQCPSSGSSCRYRVDYLSNDTSSSGFLVEDVLHLITDDVQANDADTRIIFGCGQVQTGLFQNGAAPNGLFGLGMRNISVPSVLAKEGLISNSFSMCFASDGAGRITFGDTGSPDQRKTPFNLDKLHPTYNITITQIIVEDLIHDLEFHAIFDSGTSFTYINDPAYTRLAEMFNSRIKANRYSESPDSNIPFEYCYGISLNQTIEVPFVNLTMKGGDDYYVMNPVVLVSTEKERYLICLGIQKSDSVNIIGRSDDELSNTPPINHPSHSPVVSPAIAVDPVATSNPSINPPNRSCIIKPTFTFILLLFSLLLIF